MAAALRALVAFAAAACCSLAYADGNGALIYDNGYPTGCNGTRSESDTSAGLTVRSGDDFAVTEAIGGVHAYFLESPFHTWTGAVNIRLYDDADADCLPDTPAMIDLDVPIDGGQASRTIVASPGPFGFNRTRYDLTCLDIAVGSGFLTVQIEGDDGNIGGGANGGTYWETAACASMGDAITGCPSVFDDDDDANWESSTVAFGDDYDLAFQLSGTVVRGDPCVCDLDEDGDVDTDDLLTVLANWDGPGGDCTGDGTTNTDDLLTVLAEWGLCGPEGPVNDDCDDATLVYEGTYAFDTTEATADGDDPAWSCAGDGGPDVWFCWQADCTGPVEISTCDDADYDTAIAVYSTSNGDCTGTLTEIECNDDFIVCTGSTSLLHVNAIEGQHYKIRVGGFDGATGTGNLTIVCGSEPPPNACEFALALTIDGQTAIANTVGAVIDVVPVCDGIFPMAGGAWFSVVGDGTTLTATTCFPGTTSDTAISVFCGGCNLLLCVGANLDDPECVNNAVGESSVSWCSEPGEQYLILMHSEIEGPFEIGVISDGLACDTPPACVFVCMNTSGIVNDCCEDAIVITDGTTAYDTTGANTDGDPEAACSFDGQTYHDIWYEYTASCTGILTVSTCNDADYDTDLAVYDGCGPCYDVPLLGCNDDANGCAMFTSTVVVDVDAGNCYLVRVGGWNDGDQGPGNVTITCELPCIWECPANATAECGPQQCPVDGDDDNDDGNGGCGNADPSYCSMAIGETVCGLISTYTNIDGSQLRDTDWYEFTVPPGGQEVTLTCNAESATLFGLVDHQGGACSNATLIASTTTQGNCDERSVTAFLAEGTYVSFAAYAEFDGLPCADGRNDYWLRLDGGPGP